MDAHRHPPLHQDSANEHDDGNVSFDGASPLGNFPSSVAASSTSDAPPPDHLQHQSHSPLPPQRSSHSPNPPPSSQHPLHPPNSTLNGDAGGLRQGAFASSLGQQPSSSASTNAVGGGEGSNRSSISSDGAPDLSAVGRVLGDGEEAQVPRLGKVRCCSSPSSSTARVLGSSCLSRDPLLMKLIRDVSLCFDRLVGPHVPPGNEQSKGDELTVLFGIFTFITGHS
jgi:hypothetical protein